MNAFKVVQNISSSRSNVPTHLFFTFKYCQLQSFYDLFEIGRIFFDELDGLIRNMMIFNFEHQLIHRFIWSSSFHKFYVFLIRFWRFFALIIKTFKSCYVLFWWTANEYCAQILISRTNSVAKFFKRLCYCNIRSRIALNLW